MRGRSVRPQRSRQHAGDAMPPSGAGAPPARHASRRAWATALLVGTIAVVYAQVYTHGFITEYDDPGYVSGNAHVLRGLTWDGVGWAFTTHQMGNWHPLTWLSHMVDVQLFGPHPGAHHLVNVALHIANTLLLLAVLARATGEWWPSLLVAALFALHPLHVESVAWIAERKDVLSTCLFLSTLYAYVRSCAAHSRRWYAAALAFFALGLMAKPMLVTLPFVLLLLDVWPLGRFGSWWRQSGRGPARAGAAQMAGPRSRRRARRAIQSAAGVTERRTAMSLVIEKTPFFILSALASAAAYVAQLWSAAIDESGLPLRLRAANAIVSYARYLVMTATPTDLAVMYPYQVSLPAWQVTGAALGIAAISAAVGWTAHRRPYAAVGWLWYLGTLVPVIGIVQIGYQALADRYTYIPLIGIFIIVAWAWRDLIRHFAIPVPVVATVTTALLGACAVATWAQVGVWQSSESLFAHAVNVTRENYIAHNNLGVALAGRDDVDGAIEQFRQALRIKPDFPNARINLGDALRDRLEHAVAAAPDDPTAHAELAAALRDSGRLQEAAEQYGEAIRLDPGSVAAHRHLAGVLAELGRFDDALEEYQSVLRLVPDDALAHFNFGSTLARAGRMRESIAQYEAVVRLTPDDADAWGNLAMAHGALGETAAALAAQQRALTLARAQQRWMLVKALDDWSRDHRAGMPTPIAPSTQDGR
jgi:tetratricopeptide (TPR) repeat protein